MVMAVLSVMTQPKEPYKEEEEEEDSFYGNCSLCEQFKGNVGL